MADSPLTRIRRLTVNVKAVAPDEFRADCQSIANSFAESGIGSLKPECLYHLFCLSLGQLDFIAQTYAKYHNEFRPHQALDNRPFIANIDPSPERTDDEARAIQCKRLLGGLLSHHCHRAA